MNGIQSKLSVSTMTAYFGIFKEPRGLIRALQLIFAIFAFATATNGGSSISISYQSRSDAITASWSYPYHLHNTQIVTNVKLTKIRDTLSLANDIKSSAEFFVFTGVTAMLICLVLIPVYIFLDRRYRNDERYPTVDFVITLIWTIFWIAGSSAWAQGVSNIRTQTSFDNIATLISECSGGKCSESDVGTYANIIVSVIFGFLNFLLWLGSVWFVYKETKFFKMRTAQQQQHQTTGNNFSNINTQPTPTGMRLPET